MKKYMLIMITLVMMIISCSGFAEEIYFDEQSAAWGSRVNGGPEYHTYKRQLAYQDLYLPVTFYYRNLDGSYTPQSTAVKVAKITYVYYYIWDDISQSIVGMSIATGTNPVVDTSVALADLQVSTSNKAYPSIINPRYTNNNTQYTAEIAGGGITISYRPVVYYDANRNPIASMSPVESVRRVFQCSVSGPN